MELVFIFTCRSLDFSRKDLLLRMVFKCCLYFKTLLIFVDWSVRDEALEVEA